MLQMVQSGWRLTKMFPKRYHNFKRAPPDSRETERQRGFQASEPLIHSNWCRTSVHIWGAFTLSLSVLFYFFPSPLHFIRVIFTLYATIFIWQLELLYWLRYYKQNMMNMRLSYRLNYPTVCEAVKMCSIKMLLTGQGISNTIPYTS